MNGCAFCVDMHVKQLKIAGESELRLYHVVIWHELPLFNARERAALEWAEVLTKLPPKGVPDDVYERVRAQFSEKEIADLSFVVIGHQRLEPDQHRLARRSGIHGRDSTA